MALTNLGRILILWKGVYDPVTNYDKLDAVGYDGSSYLCTKPCTGIPLSNTEYWVCIAKRGNDGQVHWNDLSETEKNDILNRINLSTLGFTNVNGFYVVDESGNVVIQYTSDGFDVASLSNHLKLLIKEIEGLGLTLGTTTGTAYDGAKGLQLENKVNTLTPLSSIVNSIIAVNEDGFYVADESGNIGFSVTNNSIGGVSSLRYEIIN